MIQDHFKVMRVDLSTGRGRLETVDGRDEVAGGSGLAALLFDKFGHIDRPWDDPEQPLIFAIGPLTGYFPLMSKTVCAFKSPYHDQYAESHAGGRSALSLKFADLDALVISGKAPAPSCLVVGDRSLELADVHFLWGMNVQRSGKRLRRMFPGAGHRSIFRIGPAGERQSAMACINVDTYRHFGRLGGGGVMGAKNLKAIVVNGRKSFPLPKGKVYPKLFKKVYKSVTETDRMHKYHDLGTAANLASLNDLKALPWRNLQATTDPGIADITGERLAKDTLLRNAACSGCPIGCIHIGYVREMFMKPNHFLYRQVNYDYEPVYAMGPMLGVTDKFEVLRLLDAVEAEGLDVMSAGVALAWATEALETGIISKSETLAPLTFGNSKAYQEALHHLAMAETDFYRLMAGGVNRAAAAYGGQDFACVLGQEMAGYATGETFFAAQAHGLRHSHLDTGGYSYDQKKTDKAAADQDSAKDIEDAVQFLVEDERDRAFLTSMTACLFSRSVYNSDLLAECLASLGYEALAADIDNAADRIQKLRWQKRLATGHDPKAVKIPKRFYEVTTWKGPINRPFLDELQAAYGNAIAGMAK